MYGIQTFIVGASGNSIQRRFFLIEFFCLNTFHQSSRSHWNILKTSGDRFHFLDLKSTRYTNGTYMGRKFWKVFKINLEHLCQAWKYISQKPHTISDNVQWYFIARFYSVSLTFLEAMEVIGLLFTRFLKQLAEYRKSSQFTLVISDQFNH